MTFLEKKKSNIHGFGIFTTKEITKGAKFYEVPTDSIYEKARPRCARIGNNKFVSDTQVLNFVNHSCEPNTKLDVETKQPFLIAIKEINSGEEITVDYNKTEINGKETKCNCKSKNCKGTFNRL